MSLIFFAILCNMLHRRDKLVDPPPRPQPTASEAAEPMDQYLPIVVLLVLAVVFGVLSALVSKLLAPKRRDGGQGGALRVRHRARPQEPPERFPVRFYLVAMIFIIFDIEIIFLYPVGDRVPRRSARSASGAIVLFAVAVFVSFVYLIAQRRARLGSGQAAAPALDVVDGLGRAHDGHHRPPRRPRGPRARARRRRPAAA